ncbi:metallo-beta-lactamase domain-containing protein 1 [Lepeophtheirus salmonis]|uniref:metallo-beta-lactamase domain-containing protein 1 n=1 Tax=Lepeophtheirus salmonis TaxID=72036 RepID=UPI001AEB1D3D|nr:metallo-beta-lactamase domain-containing protein 1-like [Lepeophtheirus salmonis]
MYNIHILSVGYSKFEKDTCLANCTSTLIKSPDINIVVDTMTPWDKDKLVRELKTHRVEPDNVDYLICTHGHSDHVGNNNLFLKAKHIVGHCVHFKDVFETTPFFENNGEFKIDGDNLKVFGTPGHTMDSISVKVQTKEGVVVIAGDTFEKEDDENIWEHLAASENPDEQRKSRDYIRKMADYIVPGHGNIFKVKK